MIAFYKVILILKFHKILKFFNALCKSYNLKPLIKNLICSENHKKPIKTCLKVARYVPNFKFSKSHIVLRLLWLSYKCCVLLKKQVKHRGINL